jgi:hypothetical protein
LTKEEKTMRTLSKLVLLAVLVLTLAILLQPQTIRCAPAVEYGLVGTGKMVFPEGEVAPATLKANITFDSQSEYIPRWYFAGEVTITATSNVDGKIIFDNKFPYTAYQNFDNSSFMLTTKGGPVLLGTGEIVDGIINFTALYQGSKSGITGYFVFAPGEL